MKRNFTIINSLKKHEKSEVFEDDVNKIQVDSLRWKEGGTVIPGQKLHYRCGDCEDMKSCPPRLLVLLALLSHSSRANLDIGQSELRSLLEAALERHLPAGGGRERRQVQSAEPGAVMYLPLGGDSNVRSQILYLSTGRTMWLTIFSSSTGYFYK